MKQVLHAKLKVAQLVQKFTTLMEQEYLLLCLQEPTNGFHLWARSVHLMHMYAYPMFYDPLYDRFLLSSNINFECLSHDYMSTICHLYITFINLVSNIQSLYAFISVIADHYQNQLSLVVPKLQEFGLVSRMYSSCSIFFPSLLYNLLFCLLCLRPILTWVSSTTVSEILIKISGSFFFCAWK